MRATFWMAHASSTSLGFMPSTTWWPADRGTNCLRVSTPDGVFLNILLPQPCNRESLRHVCEHIDRVQCARGMRMLLENPSTYVELESSTMAEIEFLREVKHGTGCGLLLDVNNVYVSTINHGFDLMSYNAQFPAGQIGDIHLAGFAEDKDEADRRLPIDSHGTSVAEIVWSLYRRAIARIGAVPTLIEWDNDVPPFPILSGEVARAQAALIDEIVRHEGPLAA